jgi:hypothetical protein
VLSRLAVVHAEAASGSEGLVEPVARNECIASAPALHHRVGEPLVFEAGVVEGDHLLRAAKLLHDLEGQLVEPSGVLAVGVGELVEVAAGLAVARGRRLGWAGRAR